MKSMKYALQAGSANPMGATYDGEGTNFAVFSAHAHKIEVCLFSADGQQELERYALPERSGAIWHGYMPGLQAGARYGLRAYGPYAPEQGHRFNPHKLLLDPYTRELCGRWQPHPSLFGYEMSSGQDDLSFNRLDSAQYVPKAVVSASTVPGQLLDASEVIQHRPGTRLIYEAHVKGLTQLHPQLPAALRGTYEGLATDAVIDHLLRLGVTTLELLPVHVLVDEPFLQRRGLRNYWGYNSIAFFTPEPRYFGPAGLVGCRQAIQRLRAAGIEVVLDVVFNHSAEGDEFGQTLCYRGLDNASYYCLEPDTPRHYLNYTGCGNMFQLTQPYVLRLVMDSLRFWVQHMGVAGFRFDLATTLARTAGGFSSRASFLDALRQDPVLAAVQLIAEPWDIGPEGYQLGAFPAEFAEWNDRYRDNVRRFWRGDDFGAQQLSGSLLGSAEHFDHNGRRSWASINMLTSHDGFTLADCTRYRERHNAANLEENRDGHHANYSDNGGVEGASADPLIQQRRQQRQRNLLATLFLSQGTPMLLAGDEIGNSQQGNNNAYCQDNALGWINWAEGDNDLLAFVCELSALRQAQPILRQTHFLHGRVRRDGEADVSWSNFSGDPVAWDDPQLAQLCLLLRGAAGSALEDCTDAVLLVVNNTQDAAEVHLPALAQGQQWVYGINTADRLLSGQAVADTTLPIAAEALLALTAAPVSDP